MDNMKQMLYVRSPELCTLENNVEAGMDNPETKTT